MIVKVILLKKTNASQSFMVRLTQKGKKSYRSIKTPFTIKEWNYKKQQLIRVQPDYKSERYNQFIENQKFISDLEDKYVCHINELIRLQKPFTFQKVFQIAGMQKQQDITVFKLFKTRIEELMLIDKISNAENYKRTFNKLKKFCKNDMLFNELDDNILLKFKKSMIKDELSKPTISIHLRNIRALFNYAIRKNIVDKTDYPFINHEIMSDLKTGYRSRAIGREKVNLIRDYKNELDEGTDIWHACNYFLFGYLGRGINFQDIARLKRKDIVQGRIEYIRYKTRSKIDNITRIGLTDELNNIINWYLANNLNSKSPYIFPILNESHILEKSKHYRIKKIRLEVNTNLKLIGGKIESEIPLTTYVWRHSFAAIAKNDLKVNISMISEMLGHKDIETTKRYLKQFSDEDLDKAIEGL